MGLFTIATRQKAKLRLALTGVSGSGKTLSSLYIAYGITGDWSKIAVIDTEHDRAKFYAGRSDLGVGQFLHASLLPPYSPERYKQYVAEAAKEIGEDGVVIVDSFTHAWSNEGGVLSIKDRISAQAGKNSYTAWNEAGKEQNSLVNTILSVSCHTIVTMRSKMDYIIVKDEKGRDKPQKVGLAPVQRDDVEYEFDIVLDLDRNHIATASKDTTFLDKYGDIITPELGQKLRMWLDEGVDVPKPEPAAAKETEVPKITREQAAYLMSAYKGDKYNEVLKKYNITRIEDMPYEIASDLITKIQEYAKDKKQKAAAAQDKETA